MALTQKDRDYINSIRRGLEKKERRNMGFNTVSTFDGTDAGLDLFNNMEESDEVKNEESGVHDNQNIPSAEIFDENDDIMPTYNKNKPVKQASRKFDNTTSIADDAGISYDEQMLGFDAGDDAFDDSNAPEVDSAVPEIRQDTELDEQDANKITVGDLFDSLKQITIDYGRSPEVIISVDNVDIKITSIDIDDSHSLVKINGHIEDDENL